MQSGVRKWTISYMIEGKDEQHGYWNEDVILAENVEFDVKEKRSVYAALTELKLINCQFSNFNVEDLGHDTYGVDTPEKLLFIQLQ